MHVWGLRISPLRGRQGRTGTNAGRTRGAKGRTFQTRRPDPAASILRARLALPLLFRGASNFISQQAEGKVMQQLKDLGTGIRSGGLRQGSELCGSSSETGPFRCSCKFTNSWKHPRYQLAH